MIHSGRAGRSGKVYRLQLGQGHAIHSGPQDLNPPLDLASSPAVPSRIDVFVFDLDAPRHIGVTVIIPYILPSALWVKVLELVSHVDTLASCQGRYFAYRFPVRSLSTSDLSSLCGGGKYRSCTIRS